MSARSIEVALPPEPALRSVILVEIDGRGWAGALPRIEPRAFQRINDDMAMQAGWHPTGGDHAYPLTWPQIIGLADSRPILVLWEPPVEDEAVAT